VNIDPSHSMVSIVVSATNQDLMVDDRQTFFDVSSKRKITFIVAL
jgi:hypothetical protein